MSYFGTDGIRGKFGQFPITPDFITLLGYVTGKVLLAEHAPETDISVVVGKDTRASGDVLAAALQAGFNTAGVDVIHIGQIPTPAISHLTKSYNAAAGVVISASHNPFQDNGIKFFSASGSKMSEATQNAVNTGLSEILKQQAEFASAVLTSDNPKSLISVLQPNETKLGQGFYNDDANGRYVEYCKGSFPYELSLKGLKIVVDCANGAGFYVAPKVLEELGADVVAIHNTPDGQNINVACGSTHPESLQEAVVSHQADVGIALDGDSDRIIMVNDKGELLDGDAILYILAVHAQDKPQGIVGTLMANVSLELALQELDIPFKRANVGDRYVMQELVAHGWKTGGENSGHIICLDKSCTGDAIVAGLQVLAIMVQKGKSLRELLGDFKLLPQTLVNVRLDKMVDPYSVAELVVEFEKVEKDLQGKGRLLIRKSGTEPVIRVMVESNDEVEGNAIAQGLAAKVQEYLQ